MKMILALEVDLLAGTEEQLFQSFFDYLHNQDIFFRDPEGKIFIHYVSTVDTVVISNDSGSKIFTADDAKLIP